MPGQQSKRYQFTWNNYTEEDIALVKNFFQESCVYGVYAKEVGENGTPHLQGYLELKNKKTIVGLKKSFSPKPHLEVAQGTAEENTSYCVGPYESKDGKKKKPLNEEHFIFGTPMTQGKRTDLEAVRSLIAEGPSRTMLKVIDSGANYQCIRYAEKVLTYKERKRNWIPTVIWLYGETGVGKTQTAKALAALYGEEPHIKIASKGNQWWDGYDAHSFVIIDEFRPDWIPYNVLLALLDSTPFLLEIKGGHRQMLAKLIVLTCPQSPSEIIFPFEMDEEKKQLKRRISKTLHIDGHLTPQEYAQGIYQTLIEEEEIKAAGCTEEEALGSCACETPPHEAAALSFDLPAVSEEELSFNKFASFRQKET